MKDKMHAKKRVIARKQAVFSFLLSFLLFTFLFSGIGLASQGRWITRCVEINESGNYIIKNNIFAKPQEKACISITASNVVIDGAYKKLNGYDEFGSKTIFILGNSTDKIKNITIKNINFKGDYTGVYVLEAEDVILNALAFQDSRIGVQVVNSSEVSISKSSFDTEQNAIYGQSSRNITISGCSVSSNKGNGIRINASEDVAIVFSFMRRVAGISIELENSFGILISRNHFEVNIRGIEARNCSELNIESNKFINNFEHGVSTFSSGGIRVSGNSFLGNAVGVFSLDGSSINLSQNTFEMNNFAAIIRNFSSVYSSEKSLKNNTNAFVIHNVKGFEGHYFSYNSSFRDFFFSSSKGKIAGTFESFKNISIAKERSDIIFVVDNNGNITIETNLDFTIEEEEEEPVEVSGVEQRRRELIGLITPRNLLMMGVSVVLLYLISSELARKKRKRRRKKKE